MLHDPLPGSTAKVSVTVPFTPLLQESIKTAHRSLVVYPDNKIP